MDPEPDHRGVRGELSTDIGDLRKVDLNTMSTVKKYGLLGSFAFNNVLDFLRREEAVKLQGLNSYFYKVKIPRYC